MQRTLTCTKYGQAKQCPDCIFNPTNQRGQATSSKVSPSVSKAGECKTGVRMLPKASA